MKIYVGSSLLNSKRVKEVQQRFKDAGCIITYDWTVHGQVTDEELLAKYAVAELQGVKEADIFFMLLPGRNGTHFEMGVAHASGKKIVMLIEQDQELKTFYYLDGVERFTEEDLAFDYVIDFLKNMEIAG